MRIGAGAMVADRCVLLPGVTIERNAVLGSGGLGRKGCTYTAGSVWVGSRHNNAVQLERGDRALALKEPTLRPFGRAFYGGKDMNGKGKGTVPYWVMPLWLHITFHFLWTAFCTAWYASTVPASLLLMYWVRHNVLELKIPLMSELVLDMIASHAIVFSTLAFVTIEFNIAIKWLVMGLRKEGSQAWDTHSYCQRWQIYLTFEQISRRPKVGDLANGGFMALLQGSWYITWFFRRLGAKIGRDVCLYPTSADPMMTEPDLVTIDDNACIDNASLICHVNSRGQFALHPLKVGAGSTLRATSRLLSGASTEPDATLLEHTLVLSGDVVDQNMAVQGWPASSFTPKQGML